MTPAEAREIDRLEFEAECAAIRQRAYALVPNKTPFVVPKPKAKPKPVRKPKPMRPRKPTGRPARRYTVDGVTLPLSQWAERLGTTAAALHTRLHKGWTIEEAVTVPKGHQRHPKVTVH